MRFPHLSLILAFSGLLFLLFIPTQKFAKIVLWESDTGNNNGFLIVESGDFRSLSVSVAGPVDVTKTRFESVVFGDWGVERTGDETRVFLIREDQEREVIVSSQCLPVCQVKVNRSGPGSLITIVNQGVDTAELLVPRLDVRELSWTGNSAGAGFEVSGETIPARQVQGPLRQLLLAFSFTTFLVGVGAIIWRLVT